MDETQDVCGRFRANVIVGMLSPTCAGKKCLLTTEEIDKVNHITIENLFEKVLSLLWLTVGKYTIT